MTTLTTRGIKITIRTQYEERASQPFKNNYVFSYLVRIENTTSNDIQLLRRSWSIFDSNGIYRKVEGEGVVGFQPVIEPGHSHEYASGCHLETDMGKMNGHYIFQRLDDSFQFKVEIPEFQLISPLRLN
jgi:ApaG protein